MKGKRTKAQQAIDGAKYAGKLLLGFAIFVCLLAGVQAFMHPEESSRVRGIFFLIVAIAALTFWLETWRKWFPGVFVLGLWPSFISIITGHVRNGKPINRLAAADYFLFFVVSTALSLPYAKKKELTHLDKAALLVAAVALAVALSAESARMLIPLPLVLLIPIIVEAAPRRRRKLMADG